MSLGQGTGRKKNKRKLTDKLTDKETINEESSRPKKQTSLVKILKDKTGQVVQDGEGLFQGFEFSK